eukprot:scaffold10406_cov68-Phaeocystis_antarctica.AAC.6
MALDVRAGGADSCFVFLNDGQTLVRPNVVAGDGPRGEAPWRRARVGRFELGEVITIPFPIECAGCRRAGLVAVEYPACGAPAAACTTRVPVDIFVPFLVVRRPRGGGALLGVGSAQI